jgi:hypothetical protein
MSVHADSGGVVGHKGRKYKPTADSHDEVATSEEITITDVTTLTSYGPPLDAAPDAFDRRHTSYGSHDVFRVDFSQPSPTAFPLSHTNILTIGCCGATFAEIPKSHMRRLFELSVPAIFGGVLGVCMNIVNLAMLGHLSPTLLGGAALGNAFMLITGKSRPYAPQQMQAQQ